MTLGFSLPEKTSGFRLGGPALRRAAELAFPPVNPSGRNPSAGDAGAWPGQLVTLVAQGRTDAQIAAQLYISIRTVRSHLGRIGDKKPAPAAAPT